MSSFWPLEDPAATAKRNAERRRQAEYDCVDRQIRRCMECYTGDATAFTVDTVCGGPMSALNRQRMTTAYARKDWKLSFDERQNGAGSIRVLVEPVAPPPLSSAVTASQRSLWSAAWEAVSSLGAR